MRGVVSGKRCVAIVEMARGAHNEWRILPTSVRDRFLYLVRQTKWNTRGSGFEGASLLAAWLADGVLRDFCPLRA